MNKTLLKFLFRKIKKNLSGFITISIIVALGVGFLVGLLFVTPDLHKTVDNLYDKSNVPDITLKSTIGFGDETIDKINEIMGGDIQYIEGSHQLDKHITCEDERLAARTIYKNFDSDINKIELFEGTLPVKENEVLVQKKATFYKDISIGSTLLIDENEYLVTGIAANPQYFSNEREYTNISPGTLDTIVYFNNEFNPNDFYTDINIVLKDGYEFNTFSKEYFEFIDEKVKVLKTDTQSLISSRYESLKITIRSEVEKAVYEELVSKIGETLADELIKTDSIQQEIDVLVEEQINKLNPEIYILDRKDNASFYMYEIQAKKTNEVAIIFPFFFIAIAALITLSTLERMIKEDRNYIGTLKSLGYKNRSVVGVYTIYSLIATTSGIVLGTLLGIFGLPYIVYWLMLNLYNLPALAIGFDFLIWFIASFGLMIAVLLATLVTLRGVLKEKPNALFTQKVAKTGGKILLERIKFIWNKLKFKYKSTCRNLFRFKKNGIMMIVGVAGSTALVVGALGMTNSISAVTEKQYNDIIIYNTVVTVDDFNENPFENFLNVEKSDIVYKINAVATDDDDFDIELYAPYKETNLNDYINFYSGDQKLEFNEDSIFISSQLSEMLGIKLHDVFFFNVGEEQHSILVNGIVENHLNNYIYMSEYSFLNIFKEKYKPNCYLGIANNINTPDQQKEFITKLSENSNVKEVNLTYQNKATYDSLLNTLQLVVIVLVLFAGALEITSIYSLTNINVSERSREIATLKVLGYRRREVVGYIYRETTILAIVGTLFGFFLGFLFHKFVVSMMQMPGMSIGYIISPWTYLIAFVISLGFFAIVDLIFFPKINNLSMIESLKSVE